MSDEHVSNRAPWAILILTWFAQNIN